jgi:pyruvate dehydrogenase E1 component alpha subunit
MADRGRKTNPTDLSNEKLVAAFEKMSLIRRVEEVAGRAYQQQKFSGFCHLYIGQEAVAVGTSWAMQEGDTMITAYREHGQAMSRGVSPEAVMAELLGKKTGSTGGRGGSMHIFDVEKGFMGGWGIVGGQIPIGAGLAFASKYRGENQVCICFMGDGSIHQGVFHEALNLASIWDLPVVFVCENNKYAMGTDMSRINAQTDLQLKAVSYAMDHDQINGQDFFDMYLGIKTAIDRARNESRPTFLDVLTYRFRGHSMSDPGNYRSGEELTNEKERDPILTLRQDLISMGISDDASLTAIDKACRKRAKDALKEAEQADYPDPATLMDHIYV